MHKTIAWEQRQLGQILTGTYNGQTPSREVRTFWNGGIPWLTSGELNRGHVLSTIEKISKAGLDAANLRIIPKNTFVIAITGLEAVGTRGSCAILDIDTALNQSCMALFPNPNLLDTGFLFTWYCKVGDKYGLTYTQGTKQQSYNANIIEILPISLPDLEEQKKIASTFEIVNEAITLHQCKSQ